MIFLAAIAWVLLLVSVACKPTAPKADEQEHDLLDVPAFQLSADPVQNAGLAAEMIYRGSSLVFDPAATATQIGDIAEGTRQTRVTKANWLRVERRDVRPLNHQITNIKQAIVSVEAEARKDNNLRAAQELTSRSWLNHRLDDEGLQGPARVSADSVWESYCEAKIWELALSPRLVIQRYERRPTPLQLCEDFYDARHLMTGSRCSPATKSTGKNYFSCLWRDGVMKTALYKSRYDAAFPDAPTVTKAQKLTALIDDGDLAASLLDNRVSKVTGSALAMDRLSLSSIFGREYKELFVPEGGTPVDAPDLALAEASPAQLITAVEDGRSAVTALQWLPSAEWSVRLASSLKDIGARPLGDLSVSDYLFQRLAGGVVAEPPRALPLVKNNRDFAYIFEAISPRLAAQLKTLRQDLTAVTASRDKASDHSFALYKEFTGQMSEAAGAATLGGDNATLWASTYLSVKRLPDGEIETRFTLDDVAGRLSRACFHSPDGAPTACPEEPDLKTDAMTVAHDPATGKLTLILPMDRQELKLVLYPNQIDDVLYFYSGALTISDGGEVLHEGGINLMTD